MASAAATRSSRSTCTEPAWKDSGLTLRAPMTATGASGPSEIPARVARCVIEPRRGRAGFLEGSSAQDTGDLLTVEGLPLEQGARQCVQLLDVLLEDLLGATGGLQDDPLDLAVDEERGLLAVVLLAGHLAAEEDVLLVLAERERAELVGHAPLADHLASHLGGLLEVVAGTGGLLVQHDLLGGAAAQQDRDAIDQVVLRVVVLVVDRQLLGQTEGAAARDDRDLVHGVGTRQHVGHER